MDKLRAMQTFVQIATDGSLTAAARSLGSSLPAVVRLLAELEQQLGARLLNRTTRRLSLTEEGERYLQDCRDILSAISQAEAGLSADSTEPSGTLVITAPVQFGQIHLAPQVTEFVKHYPKVRCKLNLNDRNIDLVADNIDVGIRIGELPDSNLVAQYIGEVRRVVVASPHYLKNHGIPQHPRELMKFDTVQVGQQPWSFMDNGKLSNITPMSKLEFNQIAPAIDACVADVGLGMFMSYQIIDQVQHSRLQIVLEDYEKPPRPINILYPHARLIPARTRVFIEWIKQRLKPNDFTTML